jgi:hypothetical protein
MKTSLVYSIAFATLSDMKRAVLELEKLDGGSSTLPGKDDLDDALDGAEELHMPTKTELKATLTAFRDEFGAPELKKLLKEHNAANLGALGQDEWPAIFASANNRLADGDDLDSDIDDDDDLFAEEDGDDDEGVEVTPEVVKAAVQAFAKKNGAGKAKEILQANGLNTVRGLPSAPTDALAKIFKAVS